jgi:hypothetical protein
VAWLFGVKYLPADTAAVETAGSAAQVPGNISQ